MPPLAAMAMVTLLAACGGGEGGGTTTGSPASAASGSSNGSSGSIVVASSALSPQTSVPAPTYAAGSGRLALYQAINDLREALGVGLLRQDPALDAAAQAHAEYLAANQLVVHDEDATKPAYYEASPLSRARKAGVAATAWIGEVAAAHGAGATDADNGTGCFNQWYTTVYHLQALVENTESLGVGFAPKGAWAFNACVVDLGTLTAVPASPITNGVPYGGGQQFATNQIVTVPRAGEGGVQRGFNFAGEAPNPAPDLSAPGRPLMVYVNGQGAEVLSVTSFQLVDHLGSVVPARILISAGAQAASTPGAVVDPNGYLRRNAVFLLPLAPLAANTTYTASFAGARAGLALSTSWSFTTGPT